MHFVDTQVECAVWVKDIMQIFPDRIKEFTLKFFAEKEGKQYYLLYKYGESRFEAPEGDTTNPEDLDWEVSLDSHSELDKAISGIQDKLDSLLDSLHHLEKLRGTYDPMFDERIYMEFFDEIR